MMTRALGVPVDQHDDGSEEGMHDLTFRHEDGRTAAVEITAAADGESIALWKLMNNRDERWIERDLVGGWAVGLLPSARAKDLRRTLPGLLRDLEQRGITALDLDLAESASAERLGVVSARQSGTSFPGSIYITIDLPSERSGGVVPSTGDCLSSWVADFLSEDGQRDVLAKLGRSGLEERHAFVLLPGFAVAPFAVIDLLLRDDAPLPTVDPILPSEVTHVWVASTWSSGCGFRWSAAERWDSFRKFDESAPSASS